jgi:hypothetical protein
VIDKEFFMGQVFKATWITDSIKAGSLLDSDDYLYKTFKVDDGVRNHKTFQLDKGWPYTLTEAIKIDELARLHPQRSKGATFWKEIEEQGWLIPQRTCESMRNFLKTQLKFGLQDFFKHQLGKLKFSHANHFLLKAGELKEPVVLDKDEKQYLRSAVWSEYSMEPANLQAGRAMQAQAAKHAAPSLDTLINSTTTNKKPTSNGGGVVTYDLRDLSAKPTSTN